MEEIQDRRESGERGSGGIFNIECYIFMLLKLNNCIINQSFSRNFYACRWWFQEFISGVVESVPRRPNPTGFSDVPVPIVGENPVGFSPRGPGSDTPDSSDITETQFQGGEDKSTVDSISSQFEEMQMPEHTCKWNRGNAFPRRQKRHVPKCMLHAIGRLSSSAQVNAVCCQIRSLINQNCRQSGWCSNVFKHI